MYSGNFILWGMMGSGKTSLGKLIAQSTKKPFFDLDDEIEKSLGMPISEIFSSKGEAFFRAHEQKVLFEILRKESFVLAVGGGCPINSENRNRMLYSAKCVFLNPSLEVMIKRMNRKERMKRPLLQTSDWKEVFKELYHKRLQFYKEAHVQFNQKEGSKLFSLLN